MIRCYTKIGHSSIFDLFQTNRSSVHSNLKMRCATRKVNLPMARLYESDEVRLRSGERISEEGEPITWCIGREWLPFVGSTLFSVEEDKYTTLKMVTQDLWLDMTRGGKPPVSSKFEYKMPPIPKVIRCWLRDLSLASNFALAFNFAVGRAARFRRDFLGKGKRAVF